MFWLAISRIRQHHSIIDCAHYFGYIKSVFNDNGIVADRFLKQTLGKAAQTINRVLVGFGLARGNRSRSPYNTKVSPGNIKLGLKSPDQAGDICTLGTVVSMQFIEYEIAQALRIANIVLPDT
ncbi:unnamed protein product, partial [marine sediment metagenome]